ncbi:MAG: pyrroline-5-carboxylate reductase [Verrucomicrobia bacterium]|nr:pyrroline-5-carboxylate reductase [Verrucomicrobiota bacterium]
MYNQTISFVGGGNLARALIASFRKKGILGSKIVVSNRGKEKLLALQSDYDIVPASNIEAAEKGDVLILAVKPQDLQEVSLQIRNAVQKKNPLVISLAAGIDEETLNEWLGSDLSIVRTMPNTATLIGKGITAIYANSRTTPSQKELAESLFRLCGSTCWVETEKGLNLMTPFIGSGIAYLYLFVEALESSALKLGIDPAITREMALQTVFSAAEMALETKDPLHQLIGQVATPGGVTEPSLAVIRSGGLFESMDEAFQIVVQRCENINSEAPSSQPE